MKRSVDSFGFSSTISSTGLPEYLETQKEIQRFHAPVSNVSTTLISKGDYFIVDTIPLQTSDLIDERSIDRTDMGLTNLPNPAASLKWRTGQQIAIKLKRKGRRKPNV